MGGVVLHLYQLFFVAASLLLCSFLKCFFSSFLSNRVILKEAGVFQ